MGSMSRNIVRNAREVLTGFRATKAQRKRQAEGRAIQRAKLAGPTRLEREPSKSALKRASHWWRPCESSDGRVGKGFTSEKTAEYERRRVIRDLMDRNRRKDFTPPYMDDNEEPPHL